MNSNPVVWKKNRVWSQKRSYRRKQMRQQTTDAMMNLINDVIDFYRLINLVYDADQY